MITVTVKDPISRRIFLLHNILKFLSIFQTVLDALVVMAIYIAVGLDQAAVQEEKDDPCAGGLQFKEWTKCQSI